MQKPVHSQQSSDSLLLFSQASRIGIKVCKFLRGNVQAWLCISAHDCHLPKVSNYFTGFFFLCSPISSHPSRWVIYRDCLEKCQCSVTWLVQGETSVEKLGSLSGQWQWLNWMSVWLKSLLRVEFCVLNNKTNCIVSAWYRCMVKLPAGTRWCSPWEASVMKGQIKLSGVVKRGLFIFGRRVWKYPSGAWRLCGSVFWRV